MTVNWQTVLVIFFVALTSPFQLPASVAAEFDEATFKQLLKELQPAPDEPWRTIPWKIALLDAQQTAAKENKPIFIWAMDGHPLGCT